MAEYGEQLEADLQRFYRVDLADMWRGEVTPRKLAVLAMHLPPDAAIYRQGDDDRLWPLDVQFLASTVDALRVISWQLAGDKSKPAPEPMPRPGDGLRGAAKESAIEARLRRWQERRGGATGG